MAGVEPSKGSSIAVDKKGRAQEWDSSPLLGTTGGGKIGLQSYIDPDATIPRAEIPAERRKADVT